MVKLANQKARTAMSEVEHLTKADLCFFFLFYLSQVAIELVKIVMKSSAEDYKNCFMNLALPYVIFSEPGPPEVTVIR